MLCMLGYTKILSLILDMCLGTKRVGILLEICNFHGIVLPHEGLLEVPLPQSKHSKFPYSVQVLNSLRTHTTSQQVLTTNDVVLC